MTISLSNIDMHPLLMLLIVMLAATIWFVIPALYAINRGLSLGDYIRWTYVPNWPAYIIPFLGPLSILIFWYWTRNWKRNQKPDWLRNRKRNQKSNRK